MPFGKSSAAFSLGDHRRRQPEPAIVERHGAAVQHAQHDGLAVKRGDRRHPEVDLLPAHGQLDAAILRQPALGDVEARHDLYARSYGGGQARRRAVGLVQHAVVAVAHAQPVLERLDMDVGRLRLDRAGDDLVHQAYHRRLAREVLQPLGVLLKRFSVGVLRFGMGGRRIRIQPVQRRIELDRHPHQQADGQPGRSGNGGGDERVERIGDRDQQPAIVLGDRQRPGAAQEPGRQPVGEQRLAGRVAVRGGDRQPQQLGIGLGQPALRHQAELQQHLVQPLPAVLRHSTATLDRARVALVELDQQRSQPLDGTACGVGLGGLLDARRTHCGAAPVVAFDGVLYMVAPRAGNRPLGWELAWTGCCRCCCPRSSAASWVW